MGMYTAISLGVRLNDNLFDETKDTLNYMSSGEKEGEALHYARTNTHPLFKTGRWQHMLMRNSEYFDYKTDFKLTRDCLDHYYLSGVCNLKDYDNEINLFLDWLNPFITTSGFIGWKMYEEDNAPTILFKEDGKIIERETAGIEQRSYDR